MIEFLQELQETAAELEKQRTKMDMKRGNHAKR